ncbi:SDR family NAD(P)-dependent oxidoreductase [Pilimelia columellifera]|uniref:SDR family oxidoreductase n=1 Tax=Pilimelia columellifera subsp. columellifera TaxID=706583 RepID=A0ABP6AF35_9ACTN
MIRDSVVVLTGASSGIGAATALELAGRGARLVLAARREDALDAVAHECAVLGAEAMVVPTDVGDADAVELLARTAEARFGRIDAWINNAGVAAYGELVALTPEEMRRIIDVNLLGVAYGTRAALSSLRRGGIDGVIVNNAGVHGALTWPYVSIFHAAKHGVRALSASTRQELRQSGERIAVCTLLPYTADTPLYAHAANHTGRALAPPPPVYPAARVARAMITALLRPRAEITVGTAGRLSSLRRRLAPLAGEIIGGSWGARRQFRPGAAPVTAGSLFAESPDDARIAGGWHGQARTALRTSAAVGLTAGTVAALARRRWAGRGGR